MAVLCIGLCWTCRVICVCQTTANRPTSYEALLSTVTASDDDDDDDDDNDNDCCDC